jgi:hypothetical protein
MNKKYGFSIGNFFFHSIILDYLINKVNKK